MMAKDGLGLVQWSSTNNARYNDLMMKPKEYLVRMIMAMSDCACYVHEKQEKERKQRQRIC